jgi:hypothetical protein
MIPAILTCVYVIYLYHSLNQEAAAEDGRPNASRTDGEDPSQLAQRLAAIEQRLSSLAPAAAKRSKTP